MGSRDFLGSIQELKEKLGAGFILEAKSRDLSGLGAVGNLVHGMFPGAVLTQTFGLHLAFRVPKVDVLSLSNVFAQLEERMIFII